MTKATQHIDLMALKSTAEKLGIKVIIKNNSIGLTTMIMGNHEEQLLYARTNLNPTVATMLARNKYLTKTVLDEAGFPIAPGGLWRTEEEAIQLANKIGYPVVIKPLRGIKGAGVFVAIKNQAALQKSLTMIQTDFLQKTYLMEKYFPGTDYRILVLDDEIIGISTRVPPTVIGDGKATLAELIMAFENLKKTKFKDFIRRRQLKKDRVFELTLEKQSVTLDSIIEKNRVIQLRQNCNLSTGGLAMTVENLPEPIKAAAIGAVRALGMRLAGVDILVAKPVNENSAFMIVELNEAPGFTSHLYPDIGPAVDVITPILKKIFPELAKP